MSHESTQHDALPGERRRPDPSPPIAAAARLDALVAATTDVVSRTSPDWSELQPLDSRGLVVSNDRPNRD